MNRLAWSIAVALAVIIVGSTWAADALKAGAARIEITPPTGHAMWGYASRRDTASTGVRDPLRARALVLAVGKEMIALVSLDLGRAPTRQSMARIRKRVKNETGIEHLFVVASHTHHGPVIELDDWPTPEKPYVAELEKKLADLIAAAAKELRPARLGVGAREVPFNRNRHSRREEKPVDRELLVLRVEDTDGKVIAHAVNFAAHATMLDAKLLEFSADYPGVLAETIEKETSAPCLFLQGAAGDLSPSTEKGKTPEEFGKALAQEVSALARTIRCQGAGTLQSREEDFEFKCRVNLGNAVVRAAVDRVFYPRLIDFYQAEYKRGVRPHLTTALLDGRIGFVGVSGEYFCGHALSLKRRARLDHLFFLGYCNDYQQYFPTIEAASEGGYGTDPFVSPAESGAGEQVVNRALIHLYQLQGKLPDLPASP